MILIYRGYIQFKKASCSLAVLGTRFARIGGVSDPYVLAWAARRTSLPSSVLYVGVYICRYGISMPFAFVLSYAEKFTSSVSKYVYLVNIFCRRCELLAVLCVKF